MSVTLSLPTDAFVDVKLDGVFYDAAETSDTTRTCPFTTYELPANTVLALTSGSVVLRVREMPVGSFAQLVEQADACKKYKSDGAGDGGGPVDTASAE